MKNILKSLLLEIFKVLLVTNEAFEAFHLGFTVMSLSWEMCGESASNTLGLHV